MKKLYTLLFLAFSLFTAQAQYTVNFENETKGSYASATVTLSGIDWDMTESLIGNATADWKNGTKSARLRGYAASSMTMLANKTNGIGNLSFLYRRYGTDAQVDWKVEYSTNDGADWTQVGDVFTAPATDDVQTFSAQLDINADVRIRIKRATETGTTNARMNIDDIVMTDFGTVASPSLAIGSPSNGTVFAPNSDVTVNLTVSNFVVGNPGAGIDGHIHYTLTPGGSMVMKYDTNPILFSGLAAGEYTLNMELVDNTHTPIVPAVMASVTFEIAALNVIGNVGEMRADVIANGAGKYYQILEEPVVTYARTTRNQKYVEDASGALLIDDVAGIISTPFVAGDAMAGLTGRTSLFSGLLQFTPTANATVASSGNTVTPQVVTIAQLAADVQAYESRLVRINGVTFENGDGTTTFVNPPPTNYNFTDGTDTMIFRTAFTESDYIGSLVPTGSIGFIALVGNFNGVAQVTARSLNDLTLSIRNNTISGLKVYPNPVADGTLYISTELNSERNVQVYDLLGKQVMNITTSNEAINISTLNTGLYVVKITEGGNSATVKLAVK